MTKPADKTLKRSLNQLETLAMAFGAMVGWGWVALAGGWVGAAGIGGSVSAFIVGGVMMIVIGLTYAELASAMPLVGGEHVYSHRALGAGWAFVCTWSIALAYISVSAFEAVALPTVLAQLIPAINAHKLWSVAGYDVYLNWVLVGIAASVAVTWVNIMGIKTAAKMQLLVTLILLLAGALLLTGASLNPQTNPMPALFKNDLSGFLWVLSVVPFLFVGFDVIPQMAEEINLPQRKIGLLIIVAVLMAIAWYSLICLAVGLALPASQLATVELAPAAAASSVWGTPLAGQGILLAGIAGIFTSWNAFLVGGSRAIYVMAKAGQLPAALGWLHPKYNTPANAILLIGALCCLAPFFGRTMLVWLVDAGSFSVVIAYGLVALSFLVLRAREPDMPRPYRVYGGRLIVTLCHRSGLPVPARWQRCISLAL
ncbi:APC family permease [Oceanicoccus sagamiensis]|uniref:APC family permease n=1 Tax=Oceanicoccus sagamiensis TaxID=716816 RepID=UPI001980E004|nr:APC family permease [Oceanicoccus sagamiensis]